MMAGQYPAAGAGQAPQGLQVIGEPSSTPGFLPGWTQHIGPQGQLYWYNEVTGESTYTRPSAPHIGQTGQLVYSGPPPGNAGSSMTSSGQHANANSPKRREKPAKKEIIPGAREWRKVTTNLGNVFYAHIPSKRSEWTVPKEIREQVDAMRAEQHKAEEEERRVQRRAEEERRREEQERLEQERAKRIRLEEEQRRKQRELEERRREQAQQQRLEAERVHADRLRILREAQSSGADSSNAAIAPESRGEVAAEAADDDEDEEAWQRRIASEIAEDAEKKDAEKGDEERGETAHGGNQEMTLSAQEGRAIFMHMLSSLNGTPNEVNPMMPWDRELPKFLQERDYTVLASVRDREDAFNEWCRLRIIEKRAKNGAAGTATRSRERSDDTQSNASAHSSREAFNNLLKSEVKSTRTVWGDFRKLWRKDRRFYSFGRDDKEREKAFREWLRELGKQKQAAAARADSAFLALLHEFLTSSQSGLDLPWQKAKGTPGLAADPRYDAVGSSTRRAELYEQWSKGLASFSKDSKGGEAGVRQERVTSNDKMGAKSMKDGDNASRALQERAEKVRQERAAMERQKHRTVGQAAREDSVLQYRQLLIDAINDPLANFQSARSALSRDNRFNLPGLRSDEKEAFFYRHTDDLNQRRLRSLEEIFLRHAPDLDVEEDVALPLIKDDDEIRRRRLDEVQEIVYQRKALGDVFREWRARREQSAREAFTQMLKENAFVDFWGRLRQELAQKRAQGQDIDKDSAGEGVDDDDEDSNAPSLLQMAKQIDLQEIHAVLRNDARYRAWHHRPDLREEWIRDYLQHMQIPKMSHFQKTLS